MLIGQLPTYLAEHLRANRDLLTGATLLNVICGRLSHWTVPGLLLIGDAAHPMSPVGGQGVNLALRDALVAANHLVPALGSSVRPAEIDAAATRVETDRLPEIAAAQQMQDNHARMMFSPDNWRTRLVQRLLPLLIQSGLLQWLHRKEYRQMSEGFLPVTLTA
jgi:2-polyprenyl-6-methoxyphenol hydroxylase-like FAD-dependent oxidoreductase